MENKNYGPATVEACAKVADKAALEAQTERQKGGEDSSYWLWCEQTATRIAKDVRSLVAGLTEEARKSVDFLHEAARYFENRPTKGEDKAFWANVNNAENCRKASDLINRLTSSPMSEEELAIILYSTHENRDAELWRFVGEPVQNLYRKRARALLSQFIGRK